MDEQSVTSPLSKGSKTKEKILKHALKLFATEGYKATTVRDIAGSIGIKQSALYNHFKNKDEILETLIRDLTSSAIVTLFDNKESSFDVVSCGICSSFYKYLFKKPSFPIFRFKYTYSFY